MEPARPARVERRLTATPVPPSRGAVAGYSPLVGADDEGIPARQGAGPSDAGQCDSAAARPDWVATACKRRSRVHNLVPVSRAAASRWASTYPMPRPSNV